MSILLPDSRPANEPWLVYDNRAALDAEGKAGMHALITGVSEYPNLPGLGEPLTGPGLGLRRLSSTALSAYLMFDWLLKANRSNSLALPLATCRLVLSPNQGELTRGGPPHIQVAPPMSQITVPRCNLDNFTDAAHAWRRDAMQRTDHATFFYFAGHGILITSGNQALLLEGFGAGGPISRHMVDTLSLKHGMAPFANHANKPAPTVPRPLIARTQFYFVDACRNVPSVMPALEELRPNPVFDVEKLDIPDDRRAPMFFAAPPNGEAQTAPEQQTLFSMALLRCLLGEAARPPDASDQRKHSYYISSQSLNEGFEASLNEVNKTYKARQAWDTDKVSEDAILCYLDGPPSVPISIVIEPDYALSKTRVAVTDLKTSKEVCQFKYPNDVHPFVRKLPAGPYQILPTVDPPMAAPVPAQDTIMYVEPLRPRLWKVRVA